MRALRLEASTQSLGWYPKGEARRERSLSRAIYSGPGFVGEFQRFLNI